jgi:hypothetical protein
MATSGGPSMRALGTDHFDAFDQRQRISRTARATRQRAAHLRAESVLLVQRTSETLLAAQELSQTANLLITLCLRTTLARMWKETAMRRE